MAWKNCSTSLRCLPRCCCLRPVLIDGSDDRPQLAAKSGGKGLEVLIPRIAHNILVEVPEQVDKAFLLRTRQRVIGGVEVRDQDASEVLEQVVQKIPFT
jgi:hypothetical protein